MSIYVTNDRCQIWYKDIDKTGHKNPHVLILLHGFTGSSEVFKKNIPFLSQHFRIIAPDLRGHGDSCDAKDGYTVKRLAMDLKELIEELKLPKMELMAIGCSLGAAILWSFAEQFTTNYFRKMIFVDQAPLQNYKDDWGPDRGNYSCNSPKTLAYIQDKLRYDPVGAHKGTIAACLGYRSHPDPLGPLSGGRTITEEEEKVDENFFLDIAMKGDGAWFGKLMADHTAIDWRPSIRKHFGVEGTTKCLIVASARSGCFPPAGPLTVRDLIMEDAHVSLYAHKSLYAQQVAMKYEEELRRRPLDYYSFRQPAVHYKEWGAAAGTIVDFGGHWCYWEDPDAFNEMVYKWLLFDEIDG